MILRPAIVERLLTKSVSAMVCAFLLVGCAFSPESTTSASLRSLIDKESTIAIETPIEHDSTQAIQEDVHATANSDSEHDVPEVEPETAAVEITTDAMVIPPSVEAQLPKTISLYAEESEHFTIELNEGKTQEDLQEFVERLLVNYFCDTFEVVGCDIDVLAKKMEGREGVPAVNGILAVLNPNAENSFYDIVEHKPNKVNLKLGDKNGHLKIEVRSVPEGGNLGLGIGLNAGFVVEVDPEDEGRILKIILIGDRERLDNRINNYPGLSHDELIGLMNPMFHYLASPDPTSNNILKEFQNQSGKNNSHNFHVAEQAKWTSEDMEKITNGKLLTSSVIYFKPK